MPEARHVSPRSGDVLLLVGTMKGAFLFRSDAKRSEWEMGGPYLPGEAVYAMAWDGRNGRHRIWAGPHSMHWGGVLRSSDDFGRSWTLPEEANVKFPEGTGAALKQIWQIAAGRDSEPDTLYCGVEPAALFVSKDAGDTWKLTEGLWNHPQRPQWMPGGGGLCLHTILLDPADPDRIRIAVSTGGMYVTEDGGASWRPSNRGVSAVFLPDKYPEFGQCVHKVVQSKRQPERMYLQN
ncbi:MAG TPA: sialidase family protein, partial [Thermoanaerobaculia bacterium]|nr:sialidase family protein [Thermoanaerobaculia bacterium]